MLWKYLLFVTVCLYWVGGVRSFGSASSASPVAEEGLSATVDTFPASQLSALQKLYNQTNGVYWTWSLSTGIPWDFSQPNANPCTQHWQGVNCSRVLLSANNYLDTVTSLNLYNNNMSGILPDVFQVFTNLTTLNITLHSKLSGSFPNSVCGLKQLNTLNIVYNQFYGEIPNCIGQLIHLQKLMLAENHFHGAIPDGVCTMTSLQSLSLANNFFTALPSCALPPSLVNVNVNYNRVAGTIPTYLCNLPNMNTLTLENNSFVGRIPDCFNRAKQLKNFQLSINYLTGTIPSNLCQLKNLHNINLEKNSLIGNIPNCQWSSNLTSIKFCFNALNGSIPESFTLLKKLTVLDLNNNALTGPMPVDLFAPTLRLDNNFLNGKLSPNLFSNPLTRQLSLGYNQFTGSIPDVIPINSNIYYLSIDSNHLIGSLPSSICNIATLLQLTVSGNRLAGSIPNCAETRRTLILVDMANNLLSGSIPAWMCRSIYPQAFFLYGNQLSGSLESCFGQRNNNVSIVDASVNHFTGALPFTPQTSKKILLIDFSFNLLSQPLTSALFATNVVSVYLQENKIMGQLPEITSLPKGLNKNYPGLFQFNISNNELHGSIPKSFYKLPYLKTLDLSLNNLDGSVNFTAWSRIGQLFLQQNQLTGTIGKFFQPTDTTSLSILDISDNEFTGTIPESVFLLEDLTTLVVGGNCLTGYIPATLCNGQSKAKKLSAISFDGIATASKCVSRIFPGALKAYTAHYQLFGLIPSCLFTDYPVLEKIHFSGNKMGGSLPSPPFISPSLSELVVSHNRITGTIPDIIQQYPWNKLDLSFNKFTGFLSDSMYSFAGSNNTLKLSVNRLSGDIPSRVLDASSIDILSGNLFTCQDGAESLPENDPGSISYQCGSNSTNSAVYTWLAVHVCLAVFIILMAFKLNRSTAAERQEKYVYQLFDMHSSWEVFNSKHASEFIGQSVGHIYNYGLLHHQLRYWIVSVTIMIWSIGLVCYPVLSHYFCTYYNSYIWAISAIYISGVPATAALLTIFLIFLLFFFCKAFQAFPLNLTTILASYDRESITKKKRKEAEEARATARAEEGILSDENHHRGSEAAHDHRKHATVDDNLKLSIIWIFLLLGNLVVVSAVNMGYVAYSHSNTATAASKSMVSFVVSIFKLVWSRIVMIVFENTLETAANETNWVGFAIFMTWISLFNNIVAPMLAIAIYSKDCFFYAFFGAADITSEIKVLQASFHVSTVEDIGAFSPSVVQFFLNPVSLFSNFSPSFAYSYGCTAALLSNFVAVFIFRFVLTGAVMPVLQIFVKVTQEYSLQHRGKDSKITKLWTMVAAQLVPLHLQLISSNTEIVFDENAQVFGIYDDFVSSITDVAIFLTFGTIFPPLAFIGCLGFILRTVFNQVIMGQVINRSRHQENLKAFVKQMNKECQDIFLLWKRSIFTVAFLLSFTWGVLTFDTLGDAVGTKKGSWTIPFCMAITGLVQVYNIIQEHYFPNAFLIGEIKNAFYFDEDNIAFGKVMELSNLVQQQVQSVQQQVQSNIIIPLANTTVANPLLKSDSVSLSSSLPEMLRNFSGSSFKSKASFSGFVPSESSPSKDHNTEDSRTTNFSPSTIQEDDNNTGRMNSIADVYDH